ncbi:PspC domain-containing protein [Pedobacter cryophilus]|uniref:PspC domain-containing protein n=1 Tax=Pedobacter cryophilus TaxID=2571271 RepID=A0A4U1C7G9_9SPHI|nr:PspC domain-containing protein [Pedobacter cryophilus]TKC00347.1 PspC domain-containing protein [Pedobacter cryophilus]
MNKTIIINISGVIFHIEEDAYEMLKNYMNEIKRHFSSYQDNFEIITDIENRIAEMFTELLEKESKQVIVTADVVLVTSKMGNTEDFGDDNASDFEPNPTADPIENKRKLFRDIDDRVIGGVCSGVGHYFGIEARWIRIAFFVLFIFYGFGLFPYLLLWIIMPKAVSRTDKMEMKGEKINLQAFQKNVEEELQAVTHNISKAHEYAKPGLGRLGSFIRDVVTGLLKFLGGTGKLILKIIGVLIITFVGFLLIAAFIALLVFLGYAGNTDVSTIFPINALTPALRPAIYVCAFLVIFIPLLGIILFIIRVLFNSRKLTRTIGFSLLMTWVLALAVGIFCIAKNATDFKEEASFSEATGLKTNTQNIYYLQMGEERTIQEDFVDGNRTKIITITGNDRDFDTPNRVDIDLHLVESGTPTLTKTYSARGKNFDMALRNARQIEYYYTQKDSLLVFDSHSELKEGSLWRNQEVRLKLNIPIGTVLYIQKQFASRFFQSQMYDCLDYDDDNEDLIKVVATKEGFTCQKTDKAIARQKEYNQENEIKDSVSTILKF